MNRPAGGNGLTPEAVAAAAREYAAGAALNTLAASLHVAPKTLRAALEAAGVRIRTRADTARLRALAQHDSDLRKLSTARLHELYWGEERPSLGTLAGRLGVAVKTLRAVLRERGIALRTRAEQLRADGRRGRVGGPRPGPSADPPGTGKRWAAGRKRERTPEHNAALGLAHRNRETRPCAWCGAPVTRRGSEFRAAVAYCDHTCCNRAGAYRRQHGPAAPRPLLVARIAAGLRGRPATWDRAEALAAEIGAGEPEILAALESV